MKVISEISGACLYANKGTQNIKVSIDIDTTQDIKSSFTSEPIHYCFMIDISKLDGKSNLVNSMEAKNLNDFGVYTKKDRLRTVLNTFINDTLYLFKEEDNISMIAYDESVYKVFTNQKKSDKENIKKCIDTLLNHKSDTDYNNISTCLGVAKNVIDSQRDKYGKNKIVVLTDTKPSFCENDFGKIVDTEENVIKATKEIVKLNIALDCICLGSSDEIEQGNYEFAYKLIEISNGRAYTIEEPELINLHLSDSIRDSHNSSIYNAKLTLMFNQGVEVGEYFSVSEPIRYFGKMETELVSKKFGIRSFDIELPELKDNSIYNYLMEVKVPTTCIDIDNPRYKDGKVLPIMIAKLKYETINNAKKEIVDKSYNIEIKLTEDITQLDVHRGVIEGHYQICLAKKYSDLFLDANRKKDLQKMREYGIETANIYEELGLYDEARTIKRYFTDVLKGKTLTQREMNVISKTSSTATPKNRGTRRREW